MDSVVLGGLAAGGVAARPLPPVALADLGGFPGMTAAFAMAPTVSVPSRGRAASGTTQIFIGLAIGIVVGYVWPEVGVGIKPLAAKTP